MNKYRDFLEKLIQDTKDEKLNWKRVCTKNIPDCLALTWERVASAFCADISDTTKFYLIEYSYMDYNCDLDRYQEEFTIYCSMVEDDTEIKWFNADSFGSTDIMYRLKEHIVKFLYNPNNVIQTFMKKD